MLCDELVDVGHHFVVSREFIPFLEPRRLNIYLGIGEVLLGNLGWLLCPYRTRLDENQ